VDAVAYIERNVSLGYVRQIYLTNLILRDRPTAFKLADEATGVYGGVMLNALA
jgi:hypothetical protein